MSERVLGVSFSLHRCSELGLPKKRVLQAALKDLGFRRFRLMSYWDIHEQRYGRYDFRELDWQLDMVAKYNGQVSLCLGARQPRWPEFHLPTWVKSLDDETAYNGLMSYIRKVVLRYKDHPALQSWQLENEAMLKSFADNSRGTYDRDRLKKERWLVGHSDKHKHPVIMTLSDSWGIPWRDPKPDAYGMSIYRLTMNPAGQVFHDKRSPRFYANRAKLIHIIKRRPTFIHELQAEPWFSRPILSVSVDEQLAQMSVKQIQAIVNFAQTTGLSPIDLWGLEWWYYLKTNHHPEIWETIRGFVH